MGTIILGVILAISLMLNVRYSVERKYLVAIMEAQSKSITELTTVKGGTKYEKR